MYELRDAISNISERLKERGENVDFQLLAHIAMILHEQEISNVDQLIERLSSSISKNAKTEAVASVSEMRETLELVWKLDEFCVGQFKKLLDYYIDSARNLKEYSEEERAEWLLSLHYNIREDLKNYIQQLERAGIVEEKSDGTGKKEKSPIV